MKTFDEFRAVIAAEVVCPPFEFVGDCIQCREQGIDGCPAPESHSWFVLAKLWRPDTHTKAYGYGYGPEVIASPHMTSGEIVKRCLVAALGYGEHEIREAFKWKGRRVFGPHLDMDLLWAIADWGQVHEST